MCVSEIGKEGDGEGARWRDPGGDGEKEIYTLVVTVSSQDTSPWIGLA